MQNSTLINEDFGRAIHQLRRILPKLSFGLVIATYLISALIMGIFHSQNSPYISFKVAAFLVPLAIQIGRGTLVFFFQLNPSRIQGRYSMAVIAATVLLTLSLWEAWLVMSPYGFSWAISVSTLMFIGWIIEIMILKEIQFTTQMELYTNKDQWEELQAFYIAQAKMKQFMRDLRDGQLPVVESSFKMEEEKSTIQEEARKMEEQEQELDFKFGNTDVPGKDQRSLLNGQENHQAL